MNHHTWMQALAVADSNCFCKWSVWLMLSPRPFDCCAQILEGHEPPLETLDELDTLRVHNDITQMPLLSSLRTPSRNQQKGSERGKGLLTLMHSLCAYASDSRVSAFTKVLLRSCHVHNRILQNLPVCVQFLPCNLRRTFGLRKGSPRLREFLFDMLPGVLKGFISVLQAKSEYS